MILHGAVRFHEFLKDIPDLILKKMAARRQPFTYLQL